MWVEHKLDTVIAVDQMCKIQQRMVDKILSLLKWSVRGWKSGSNVMGIHNLRPTANGDHRTNQQQSFEIYPLKLLHHLYQEKPLCIAWLRCGSGGTISWYIVTSTRTEIIKFCWYIWILLAAISGYCR